MNSSPFKNEGWLYGLAFLLALGFRLIQLGASPLTDSEATLALQALHIARDRFARQWGRQSTSIINMTPQKTQERGGLQAVDYFLWSLQRFYERREDRYVELLWNSFRLVHDLDDTRRTPYGVYYTRKKPLTLAALDNDSPGI